MGIRSVGDALTRLSNTQLDRLGEKIREGKIDKEALASLNNFRASFFSAYTEVEKVLADYLHCKVTGRPSKSTIAIVEKLRRETTRLTQIQDIAGCRIIVHTLSDQDSLASSVSEWFSEVEVDDRRLRPSHGYRALHLIPRINGRRVEIQIRSFYQHIWAEISEKLADRYGQDVKYGKGDLDAVEFLQGLSSRTEKIDLTYENKLKAQRESEIIRAGHSREAQQAKKEIKRLNLIHKELIRSTNVYVSTFLKSRSI